MTEQEQEEHVVDPQRVLKHAAETIARLANLEEFAFLRTEVANKQRRMQESLSSRLMGGEALVSLQRQSDYDRGFVEGMLYPFKVVESAIQRLAEWDSETVEPEEVTDMWSRYG